MDFTFGIQTNGANPEFVDRIVRSIREQSIPNYEILIVGKNDISGADVTTIPFDEVAYPMSVTKKRNLITRNAKYENIVMLHDYIVLTEGWYEGFLSFGSNFSLCNSKIVDLHGRRGIDYTLYSPFLIPMNLRHKQLLPYDYPPSQRLSKIMYLPGNYIVIKRDVALKFPFDERLRWNELEDVVLSQEVTDAGHISQCNPYSTVRLIKDKGEYYDVSLNSDDVEYLTEMSDEHYEHLAHISRVGCMKFQSHYVQWRTSRMAGISKYIPSTFFKSKSLLEVGCGYGDIGNEFYKLGSNVTCSDARKRYIEAVNKHYPYLNTVLFDGDNDMLTTHYDIIIHWGLLYHLKEIEQHLERISKCCDVLILETEVSDADDDSFFISVNEEGYDQAFNSVGIRPSPTYVEKILKRNGFQYKLIQDPILNASFHVYDWNITNSKTWKHGLRRFWICWKGVESPLLENPGK